MNYGELERVIIQEKQMGNKAARIKWFVTNLCSYMNTSQVSLDAAYILACSDMPRLGNEKVISKTYFKKICNDTWRVVKDSSGLAWIDISIDKEMGK